jgi:hypothetical protein
MAAVRARTDPAQAAAAIAAGLAERAHTPRATVSYDDAVALICAATGWPVGHLWAQTPSGWRSSGAWWSAAGDEPSARASTYAALREATAATDLGSGRGIVAAVLHLESCRFLPGLEGLGSPFRQGHAAALGLRAVVGVPVHTTVGGRRKVTAVFEFITAREVEPDGALAQALLDVASRTRRRPSRNARQPVPAAAPDRLDVELPDHLAG